MPHSQSRISRRRNTAYPDAQELTWQWGELVKNARIEAGLTQVELAARLGTTAPTVCRYEGGFSLSLDAQIRIAGGLGLHPAELFPWPDQRPPMPKPKATRRVVRRIPVAKVA